MYIQAISFWSNKYFTEYWSVKSSIADNVSCCYFVYSNRSSTSQGLLVVKIYDDSWDELAAVWTMFKQGFMILFIVVLIWASRNANTNGFNALLAYCIHLTKAPTRPISTGERLQGKQNVNTNAATRWGSHVTKNAPHVIVIVAAVLLSRRSFLLKDSLLLVVCTASSTVLRISEREILKMSMSKGTIVTSARRNKVTRI